LPKLAKDNIVPGDPTFSMEHERVREDRFWPYFKEAIGAIDGSHVKLVVPLDDVVSHTNRHAYTSQNVLPICDFDMRFIFVVPGWPGAAHDSHILNHALANFSSFPLPPKGNNGFLKYYSNSLLLCILIISFYRKILSCGLGLSEPNWVSCTFQRKHVPYPRISESFRASSSEV
jgi:hypothetical protein